ncbi:aspartic peptidase A1 [Panus rudis PR-1116 ss-1]|nr:aspartic peptidase A1 [Panus rudis PR-1116 ss-1]
MTVAKHYNLTGFGSFLEKGQARAKSLRQLARAKSTKHILGRDDTLQAPATNDIISYVVNVDVGSPPTTYTLLLDSGSSNTWVGASKPFQKTSTTVETSDQVSVSYGSGAFFGEEVIDTISLGSGITVSNQSIGVATQVEGLPKGFDGILGIGPVDLTVGTLDPDQNTPIPTITDNLFAQGIIQDNVATVAFAPSNDTSTTNGELTFGTPDSSKFTGSIHYAPVTRTSPSSSFWGIDQTIRYGDDTPILSATAGVIDTGTEAILIASDAFQRYQAATGAAPDDETGFLSITTAQYANLKSLFFNIGGTDFELVPNAQIWPRALNTAIGGDNDHVYLIIGDLGTESGQGMDFINGMPFLERFYTVFDTGNRQIGLATTPFTNATAN